jgi:hypothetical protein
MSAASRRLRPRTLNLDPCDIRPQLSLANDSDMILPLESPAVVISGYPQCPGVVWMRRFHLLPP